MPPMQRSSCRSEHPPWWQSEEKQAVPGTVDRLLRHLPHWLDEDRRCLGRHTGGSFAMSEGAYLTGASHEPDRILRPLERRVLRLVDEGVGEVEIARRFRRSPEMIRRIIAMTRLPRTADAHAARGEGLRPLERRVLRWRDRGAAYTEIGPRFRRSPAFVERVEVLARYKLEQPGRADP